MVPGDPQASHVHESPVANHQLHVRRKDLCQRKHGFARNPGESMECSYGGLPLALQSLLPCLKHSACQGMCRVLCRLLVYSLARSTAVAYCQHSVQSGAAHLPLGPRKTHSTLSFLLPAGSTRCKFVFHFVGNILTRLYFHITEPPITMA